MQTCAQGRVTRLLGTRAEVVVHRQEACAACATADLCHGLGGRGTLTVQVDNPVGAQVGELVEIASARSLGLRAAFFVYLIPALLFVAGVVVGAEILAWPPWASALLGIGALAASWLLARWFDRRTQRRAEYRLTVARVLARSAPAADSEVEAAEDPENAAVES